MLNESHVIAAAVPERTAIGELYSVVQLQSCSTKSDT